MGLTLHYRLSTGLTNPQEVRELVEAVRQFTLDLPFEGVSEIAEFSGDDPMPEDEIERWLRLRSEARIEVNGYYYRVPATSGIVFSVRPGEGCEPANFGFCKYPDFIDFGGKQVATELSGWMWRSFCKTQYASTLGYGGVRLFLRCHLGVTKILDLIRATSIAEVEVNDDGGYWEQRDVQALVQKVADWNEFMAGLAGERTDATGAGLESAILDVSNFEYLEEKALERLAKLRQKKR